MNAKDIGRILTDNGIGCFNVFEFNTACDLIHTIIYGERDDSHGAIDDLRELFENKLNKQQEEVIRFVTLNMEEVE